MVLNKGSWFLMAMSCIISLTGESGDGNYAVRRLGVAKGTEKIVVGRNVLDHKLSVVVHTNNPSTLR